MVEMKCTPAHNIGIVIHSYALKVPAQNAYAVCVCVRACMCFCAHISVLTRSVCMYMLCMPNTHLPTYLLTYLPTYSCVHDIVFECVQHGMVWDLSKSHPCATRLVPALTPTAACRPARPHTRPKWSKPVWRCG